MHRSFAALVRHRCPSAYACARLLRGAVTLLVVVVTCLVACQTAGPEGGGGAITVPPDYAGDGNAALPDNGNAAQGGGTTGDNPSPSPATDTNAGAANPNATPAPLPTSPNRPTSSNPNLYFVGRMVTADSNGPVMSWPGSKIVAGFSGTSLVVKLRAVDQQTYWNQGNVDNYVDVRVDGGAAQAIRIRQNVTDYALAQNLTAGAHTVEVSKRTEAQIGSLQFLGFGLDANATLVPGPTPRRRRIEFIGDSGTVGYGADGNQEATGCGFSPETENALVAYSVVAGDLLAADVHVTSQSGKGIYQNRDTQGDKYNTLPVLWTWTNGDTKAQPDNDNDRLWDPNRWVADAVVVVVGGNDFAASTPPAAAYNATATQFLRTLRTAYPNAWLFVTISPLLDPPQPNETSPSTSELGRQYARTMVSSMNDAKVAYLDVSLDDGSRGYGCDYHPNAASHRIFGQYFAQQIRSRLGW